MDSREKAIIEKFRESSGNKPYKKLFVLYKQDILNNLNKGCKTQDIQKFLESETGHQYEPANFRYAFYRFKKELNLEYTEPNNNSLNNKSTLNQQPMKKLTFVIQSKGGVGKSALTYMLANKLYDTDRFDKTLFVDMDDETRTTSNQLQFATINSLNLISQKTKQIDRSLLDKFFVTFVEQEEFEHAICDMGATTSEQFQRFLEDEGSLEIMEALTKDLGLTLEILCVVAGDNSFKSSATFCHKIFDGLGELAELKIVKNTLFNYSEAQDKELNKLAKTYNAEVMEFGLLGKSSGEGSLKEIKELMQEGKAAIKESSFTTKIRFNKGLENFPYVVA